MARLARAGLLVLLLGYAAGCTSDAPGPDARSTRGPAASQSGSAGSPSPTDSPSSPGSADPTGVVEPRRALLEWTPTGSGPEERRIVGPAWTAVVDERGGSVTLTGPDDELTVSAAADRVVADVLMDADWAVVVAQDGTERRPSEVTVVDLDDASTRTVTDPVPAPGGSWSLHDGTLRYGTLSDGDYCVAQVDLAAETGEVVWCAPPREGFTRLTAGRQGVALLTFDDRRPISCRTPRLVREDWRLEAVEAAARCSAWDVAATATGAVWSEVADERRAEEGTFHAVADGTAYSLGPGTTGTLTPCGDSVYFVRDPASRDDPSRLLRWTPDDTLEVVFESRARGRAFLAPPQCAGGVLTVSSFGPRGDEQVTAVTP